ncbi:MAG TPA: Ig-like domain-containing protein [Flavobacteriaceae bacterium]|nr:Ig-like domain-containing protein [Flavobacteriaceae bacterium]
MLGLSLMVACSGNSMAEDNSGPVLVQSIVINGSNIQDGNPEQLAVVVLPNNATNREVIWSVSNTSVATISDTGLLTPLDNGTVTVTATAKDASGVSADKVITISGVAGPPVLVESIAVIGVDITDGNPEQLTVEVLPADATNKAVTWAVSDISIGEIEGEGLLTPKANGTVTITATAMDGSGTVGELVINISGITEVPGTVVSTPQELLNALASATAGDNIYVKEGIYNFGSTINISSSGTSGNLISVLPHPDNMNRPKLDFSTMAESSANRGTNLSGSYWYIKGIDVFKAGDNGMFISGSNNVIEFCTFSENSDTGLQIGNGGSNNTILNCDSFYNADSAIENADGFACKLDAGNGNKFMGCRAWQNLDDGWDGYLRGTDNITTTYEDCWAFKNGYLKDGSVSGGDGNGFKTGGSDDKLLKHNGIYKNCVSAGNGFDGFDHNSNRGDVVLYNCSAYANGRNIGFSTTNIANSLTIKNTASLSGGSSDSFTGTTTDITNNSWQNGIVINADDFVSLDIDLMSSPRKADGSLPDVDFMNLVSGSDLIDAGVDVGLSYLGVAPDIGAFEKE